jgi:hypothetical protein
VRHPRPIRRPRRSAQIRNAVLTALAIGVIGCTQSEPRTVGFAAPKKLHWHEVAGADRYQLRAWNEYRLLFDVESPDTFMIVTPALSRVLSAFPHAELEVRPLDAAGNDAAAPWRQPIH